MNYKNTTFESFFYQFLLLLELSKTSSASPISEMLNCYNDRSYPEFLLFVYANLFCYFQ